jgi:S1-C subfamily serine protease
VANSLNNLAMLYRDTGRYAEAEPLYRRALLILKVGSGQTLQTVVVRVLPNSQAAQIGLQSGDIIDSYDGERIVQLSSLIAALGRPGDSSRELVILRDGQTIQFKVAPGFLGVELRETAANARAAAEAPSGPSAEERR